MSTHSRKEISRSSARVLVTEGPLGQAKSALAAVRALAAAGYRPVVTVSRRHSLAAASRYCTSVVRVPPIESPNYRVAIEAELAKADYLTVLPTSDAALLALDWPVRHLVDKVELVDTARRVGLDSPPIEVFASRRSLLDAASSLEYPVVAKAVISRPPAIAAWSPLDLQRLPQDVGSLVVQPYLGQGLRSLAGVIFNGRLLAAVHQRYVRLWPSDCGGACAAETTAPDLDLEHKVIALLEGYEGIFHVQLVGDTLIDANARVYGSLPLAVAAGANLAAIYCDLLATDAEPAEVIRARPGIFYRWLEGDLRHVVQKVRTREIRLRSALGALRPRSDTAHGPESFIDPMPMLARVGYAIETGRWRRVLLH